MKNFDAFKKEFEELKSSILANENATTEEVAIWLDLNNMTSCKALIRLFKIISFYYHSTYDFEGLHFQKLKYPICSWCFSDVMFKNLFYVMFTTNTLDKAILKKEFMKFAKYVKERMKKTTKRDPKDRSSLDLYEIYAELVDRLEEKFA